MTIRQLGVIGIKLIGVYYGATAVLALGNVLGSFFVPHIEGLPTAGELAVSNLFPAFGFAFVAAVCLLWGERLATSVLPAGDVGSMRLSRRDVLFVGVALVGFSMALAGVPVLVEIAGKALWYVEGSRQSYFWPAMQNSWERLAASGLSLVIGSAVVIFARALVRAIDPDDA